MVVPNLGDTDVPMRAERDVRYEAMPADANVDWPVADTDADSTFMIIYTSGTTGRPKGTVHVHGGFPGCSARYWHGLGGVGTGAVGDLVSGDGEHECPHRTAEVSCSRSWCPAVLRCG